LSNSNTVGGGIGTFRSNFSNSNVGDYLCAVARPSIDSSNDHYHSSISKRKTRSTVLLDQKEEGISPAHSRDRAYTGAGKPF